MPDDPNAAEMEADNRESSAVMNTDFLAQALRGANHEPAETDVLPLSSVLVVGAGGTLGAALLAHALVAGRFQRVRAVATGTLASTLRRFETLPAAWLADGAPRRELGADTAFVVFERERRANGRDDAFLRPEPGQLTALARALHGGGVRRLLLVVPHAPALLPHALKYGFASHDEAEVAALGFEQLVIVRSSQGAGGGNAGAGVLTRFAGWWLSQLAWMVPRRDQALRSELLAPLLVHLARRLPAAPGGTRVLPPEVLVDWSERPERADAAMAGWLGMAPKAALG